MVRITLYAKARCHLCEVMHTVVDDVRRNLRGEIDVELQVVDITTDSALMARYRLDVPVLEIDGVERFRHRVEASAFEAAVREAARAGG